MCLMLTNILEEKRGLKISGNMLTYDPMELAWDRFLKQDDSLLGFFEDVIENWKEWESKLTPQYVDVDVPLTDPETNTTNPEKLTIIDLTGKTGTVHELKIRVKRALKKIELYKKWKELKDTEVQEGEVQEGLAGLGSSSELIELEKDLGFDDKYRGEGKQEDAKKLIEKEDALLKDLEWLEEEGQKGGKVNLKSEFENLKDWDEFTNKLKGGKVSEGHLTNLTKIKNILNELHTDEYRKSKNYFISSIQDYGEKLTGTKDFADKLKGNLTQMNKLYEWVRDLKETITSKMGRKTHHSLGEDGKEIKQTVIEFRPFIDDPIVKEARLKGLISIWKDGKKRFDKEGWKDKAEKVEGKKKQQYLELADALGRSKIWKVEDKILNILNDKYTGEEFEEWNGKTYLQIILDLFDKGGQPFKTTKSKQKERIKEHKDKLKLVNENITYNNWNPVKRKFEPEFVKSSFREWNEVRLETLKQIRKLEEIIRFLKVNEKDKEEIGEEYSEKLEEKQDLENKIGPEYVEKLNIEDTIEIESDEPKNPFKVKQ